MIGPFIVLGVKKYVETISTWNADELIKALVQRILSYLSYLYNPLSHAPKKLKSCPGPKIRLVYRLDWPLYVGVWSGGLRFALIQC